VDEAKQELIALRDSLENRVPTKWVVVTWWARAARPFFERNAPYLLGEFDRYVAEPNYIVVPPISPGSMHDPWTHVSHPETYLLANPRHKQEINRKEHRRLLMWLNAVIQDWEKPKRLKKSGYIILLMGRRVSIHTIVYAMMFIAILATTIWAIQQ
jgi:hypothetical protein